MRHLSVPTRYQHVVIMPPPLRTGLIIVLRTLAGLIRFEMLGIAAKYDIKSIYFPQQQLRMQFGHHL